MELELWMGRKDPSPVPNEMVTVARMKAAGIRLTYQDWDTMPALLRDDFVAWGIAEANVMNVSNE